MARQQTMKCKHGRTAEYVMRGDKIVYYHSRCLQCDPPRVTPTGRAISEGRATRATYSVKRAHDGKPLPLHLQCHPIPLTRTPKHPKCETYNTYAGLALRMQRDWGVLSFINGKGLKRKGKYQIVGEKIYGYTDDPIFAKAWRSAANHYGIQVNILEG